MEWTGTEESSELKKEGKEVKAGGRKKIYEETDGAERHREKEEAEEKRMKEMLRGMAKCSVCGGESRIKVFGLRGLGVWVGCDRSEECIRNIEKHDEGWSIEECVNEWNRNNSGLRRIIRKIKSWIRKRYGKTARTKKEYEKRKKEEKEKKRERMREVFGIKSQGKKRNRIISWIKRKK